MARTDTLINFLTDVAAAIKAKKGDSKPILAANFDTEIANLPSGDDETIKRLIDRTITSFEIPEGVEVIGYGAFYRCIDLTSVTIPNSVKSLDYYAFHSCMGLTSITIPGSVKSIGNSAFSGCSRLTEIDFSTHTTVPTLISTNAFSNTSASLVIKVPSALVDEWKAATNWSTYADKIVGV